MRWSVPPIGKDLTDMANRTPARPPGAGPWRRIMTARDPRERHRASTSLELLFDLTFVVAVSQAASALHHSVSEALVGAGVIGYLMVFFAIWWAWMNFTWFASAFDADDVPYRLLTLLQMAGVLVLAAGVPAAESSYDFTTITLGYVVMRVAMVGQLLRAAAAHPPARPTALRYAAGIAVVQVGWLARLALPHPWDYVGFAVLVLAELAVPAWAEGRGGQTSWHPDHIGERYGLFTIIVLGEVILAASTAIQSAISDRGVSAALLVLAGGGLLLVFSLWWVYFAHAGGEQLRGAGLGSALGWGYGHYAVFAAVAALGAGLEVAADTSGHVSHVESLVAAFAVAVPVAVCLLVLAALHAGTTAGTRPWRRAVLGTAVLVLLAAGATTVIPLAVGVLVMGGLLAGLVAITAITNHLAATRPDPTAPRSEG